jgi:hypothetical protein
MYNNEMTGHEFER